MTVQRSFSVEGRRLNYEVHGDGDRVVVLLHGLLMDANLNRGLAVELSAHGNRVVLLDLLGHGASDKPRHAASHRMDLYARQVVELLDELGVSEAVVGGVSLGANVALQVAVLAPERIRGLIIEMPVLEWGVPAGAAMFVPLLFAVHYAERLVRLATGLVRRVPRTGLGQIDGLLNTLSLDPEEMAAVLHGLLLGPIAPTVEQRQQIEAPTVILGHRGDMIHPFRDAQNLAGQLRRGRLLEARSIAELRFRPARLVAELVTFLDEVWAADGPEVVPAASR